MATSLRARRWCFTCNNYSDADESTFASVDARYVVYGREVGAQGTRHLQGFICFGKPMRMAGVKKVHATAHWEISRGTNQQASDYCKKDGDFFELGTLPSDDGGSEEKARWANAFSAAKRGAIEEIPEDILVRHYRTWKDIRKDYMVKPDDAPSVTGVWFYGPPGVGKSFRARAEYPDAYLKMQNKWWDGYQNEKYVILDDFDSKELGHMLKIWADRYSFLAETKGGAIHIRPEKIIITSNYAPDQITWNDHAMKDAIVRRFEIIRVEQFTLPTPAE